MVAISPVGATIPGVIHHLVEFGGGRLHYVSAGNSGAPILLVHGFPETWWAFRELIPLMSVQHHSPDFTKNSG